MTQFSKNLAFKLSVASWIAKYHQHVSFKIAYAGLDWSSERILLLLSFAGNDSWWLVSFGTSKEKRWSSRREPLRYQMFT